MDNTFNTHIKILKQAIEHNKLVVFAGAGVSRDAGIPNWFELKNELKKDINIDEDENDALKIAQIYYNERDEKEYIAKVRHVLKYKQVKYQPTHELIFKLNPLHIITTNFDDLFEQVIEDKLYPFSSIVKDSDFPFALNTNFLVKVHGDLTETNIVLKEDDFLSYSRNHPLFESFIRSVFASKVVLFVGYSFSDPNLQSIIQHVKDILGENFQYAYLFNSASKIHSSQKEYLKRKGIQLISYSEHKKEIEDYLNGENCNSTKHYRNYYFSDEGQHTCNFLNFLCQFNYFNEELKERNFIDKLYMSLQRYSDVVSLDGYFTVGLYPIKTEQSYYYLYQIHSDNQEFISLYRDHIIIENGIITIINLQALGITEKEKKEYELKLTTVTRQLNFSRVFWIVPIDKKNNEKPISIRLESNNCQCLSCRYLAFKLDGVAEELNAEPQTRDLRGKLLYGYVAYKFGDWEKALKIFSEIASEAWKAHRYILYYLCKKNIKTLHNLVRGDFRITEKKREELLKQIQDTDLDKLLNQLSGLSDDEYKLLRIIRDHDVIVDTFEKVHKSYIDIADTYHLFKNGGWSSQHGDTDINKLLTALDKLFYFHWNNNIVLDAYTDFTDITSRVFEGVIISNATSESYGAKLTEFNAHLLRLMVLYGKSELEKTLNNYEIKRIPLDEANRKAFIELARNFLQSFPKKKSFFGNSLNESIKSQLRFENFRNSCSRYFSNFMVLLSYIELNKELAEGLIYDLIIFLEVQDFLSKTDLEKFSFFMERQPQLFDTESLNKIIKVSGKKQSNLRTERDFWWAVYKVKENNLRDFLITDEKLISEIVSKANNDDWAYQYTLAAIYFLTDGDLREKVKARIVNALSYNFSPSYYEYLVINEIIDKEEFKEKYAASLNLQCKIEFRNELPYWVDSPAGWARDTVMFLVGSKFPIKGKILEKVKGAPEFIKFAIKPDVFDYSTFKVEWIYLYKYRPDVLIHLAKSKKFREELDRRKGEIKNIKLQALYFKYFT